MRYVDLLQEGAEAIGLPDNSAATVFSTFTFCTIPDLEASLAEIRRVLKPEGRLAYWEHGIHRIGGYSAFSRFKLRFTAGSFKVVTPIGEFRKRLWQRVLSS